MSDFIIPDGPCVTDHPKKRDCVQFGGRYLLTSELYHRTTYSYSSIIKIFSGLRQPSMSGAILLADLLNITVDELLRELSRSGSPRMRQKRLGNHDLSLI